MTLQNEITSTVTPGDDFYTFVNKKWLDSHPIPPEKSRYAAFTELDETVTRQLHELITQPASSNELKGARLAKQLYASGMDESAIEQRGIKPIQPLIDEVNNLQTNTAIHTLIARHHSNGRGLVWSLGLDIDEKNSQRYVMQISQSGLLLPDRDYYFEKDERFDEIRNHYHTFLKDFFTLIGYDNVSERADNVYKIEEKLASFSNTAIENRDVDAKYNPYSFANLQKEFGIFDWSMYKQTTNLDAIDTIIVQQPQFLRGALSLIDELPLLMWQDYFIAHTVVPYLRYLSPEYDQLQFHFFGHILTGAEQQEERYKRIIKNVSYLLPEPTGQLYVEAHFDEAAKATITDLVHHIQSALAKRIDQLDWMSQETKERAHEKLATFLPLLGYPDTWRSYESLDLEDDYVANIQALHAFEWQYDTSRAAGPVNRQEWLMSPATVNAYYWPNTNGITFPAAILQPPFFDASGDFASNYGGIGVVIGHEIIHGFDDKGSKYDKVGNLNSWWKEADREAFDTKAKRLAQQYDGYKVNGHSVKGDLTLGENIADLGGVLLAYDALQQKISEDNLNESVDGFTPEKRFFLSYARIWRTNMRPEMALQLLVSDPHSPAEFRVNGVLPNVDSWYDAFEISAVNSLYKPESDRIKIW